MKPEQEFVDWIEDTNQSERDRVARRSKAMGMKWNPNEVPDSQDLAPDNYDCEIESIEERYTKDAKKLMYAVTFKVRAPKEFAGENILDWIVIGTDDCLVPDPNHANKDFRNRSRLAWKKQGARLKQIFSAAHVPMTDDLDDSIKSATRKRIGITLAMQPETTKSVNDQGQVIRVSTGNMRARISRNGYFSVEPKSERPIGAQLAKSLSAEPRTTSQAAQAQANGQDDDIPFEEGPEDQAKKPAPKARAKQFDMDME